MMKRANLLHLITSLEPAGAETLLVSVVRKLNRKKFRVVVGYIYGQGTLAGEMRKAGAKVVDLSRRGEIDPFLIIRIFLLIRREKIKIVHTHLVHASVAGRIAAKLAGVKNIITTRHYAYYHKRRGLVNWMERKTAVLNNRFIAVSDAVREYMQGQEKYKPEKIMVIHNAVDLDFFRPADGEIDLVKNGFVIGSVGRLHPSKGYDTLLKSMPEVMKKFPQAKLVIAGNGAERASLEGLRSQLGLPNKVIFLGRKTPGGIRSFLREISLFVLASNWEGFGLAAVEAMASGVPVVATRVGGLPEIVEDGRTGFLVPPGHPQALADKINFLLENKRASVQMGERGRKRAESLCSLTEMVAKLEHLYQSVLDQDRV